MLTWNVEVLRKGVVVSWDERPNIRERRPS